jgi:hypothetical protein
MVWAALSPVPSMAVQATEARLPKPTLFVAMGNPHDDLNPSAIIESMPNLFKASFGRVFFGHCLIKFIYVRILS